MSRLPVAKDGGEIILIDNLMFEGIVFHKHNFYLLSELSLKVIFSRNQWQIVLNPDHD